LTRGKQSLDGKVWDTFAFPLGVGVLVKDQPGDQKDIVCMLLRMAQTGR
jgi:hypothetical protein